MRDFVVLWNDSGTRRARNGFVQSHRATTAVLTASSSSMMSLIRWLSYFWCYNFRKMP